MLVSINVSIRAVAPLASDPGNSEKSPQLHNIDRTNVEYITDEFSPISCEVIMKSYSAALLVLVSLLSIGSPASAQDYNPGTLNVTSVVTDVFKTVWSPNHRTVEIQSQAEVEKARIQQQGQIEIAKIQAEANKKVDNAAPVLTEWGVTRVSCTPGGVFINGLSGDTVCISPTAAIPAGYYNYNSASKNLVRIEGSSQPNPSPVAPAAIAKTPAPTAAIASTPAPATPTPTTPAEPKNSLGDSGF